MVAVRCVHAALWTFQHSLHSTLLKGPLSRELPHQHPWPPTQTSAERWRASGALGQARRTEPNGNGAPTFASNSFTQAEWLSKQAQVSGVNPLLSTNYVQKKGHLKWKDMTGKCLYITWSWTPDAEIKTLKPRCSQFSNSWQAKWNRK